MIALVIFSGCGKNTVPDPATPPPVIPPTTPVVTKTCRLTNYSTDEDLGGNGSQFGFSYDANFNLVQVTGFQLNGYPGVTVKIGPEGVNRDNGLSVLAWQFDANIYTGRPAVSTFTLASSGTPEKQIENYKYNSSNQLYEVDILDVNTAAQVFRAVFTYDDNNNCNSISFVSGPSGFVNVYKAGKYDDHPSGYSNIPNPEFMFWIDRWGLLNSNIKYLFDIMSAHNILEWTHGLYDQAGILTGTENASFVYDFYTTSGRPQNRTESYYLNGTLKATHKDVWSYTDCD